jgi:hypothetical protein
MPILNTYSRLPFKPHSKDRWGVSQRYSTPSVLVIGRAEIKVQGEIRKSRNFQCTPTGKARVGVPRTEGLELRLRHKMSACPLVDLPAALWDGARLNLSLFSVNCTEAGSNITSCSISVCSPLEGDPDIAGRGVNQKIRANS